MSTDPPDRFELGLEGQDPVTIGMRPAVADDVPAIRYLLADDRLGARREDFSAGALARYRDAFTRVDADPRNELWLAVLIHTETSTGPSMGADSPTERPVGMYQVTYIPYLSRGGNERALIEAVRVASAFRGRGLGGWMMRHALAAARARGCLLAQLTTDRTRTDAHRFYERLGFSSSHVGMKLDLTRSLQDLPD